MAKPRSCSVCGCTDDDCSDCVERTGSACHWVGPRLCSACATPKHQAGSRARGKRGKPEADFQKLVIDFAHLHKWTVAHFRPARVKRNGKDVYETPIGADGKGWPDLVLVRDKRIVAAELKSDKGRATEEQEAWLDRLEIAGVETHIWKPADWESIKLLLGGPP